MAIKFEPVGGQQHTLKHKFHVYQKPGGVPGIPHVHWFGIEVGFNVFIDHLGPSLEDLFMIFHFRFSVKTVILLVLQLLSELSYSHSFANTYCTKLRCLQYIHSQNFVHRDLKPSNIIMGVYKHAHIVHLINFALSKEFRDPDTHLHIPCKESLGIIGTATFASLYNHIGLELGR